MTPHRSLLRCVLLFLVLAAMTLPAIPQVQSISDEILVLVPSDKARELQGKVTLRWYQRLPGWYIAGVSRIDYGNVPSSVGLRLIDENAWTEAYALVSEWPGRTATKNYNGLDVRLLASVGDVDLVTGSHQAFEKLRSAGFSCVEIEQRQIPVVLESAVTPSSDAGPPDDNIARIISAVSESTITSTIQGMQDFGTRWCLNANRDSVFRWVRQRFLDAGVTDVVFDSFQYSGTWQKNVIATMPGTVYPSVEIIVGGHLDSYSSNLLLAPGADDNATGTTAAVEMARVLIQENYQPKATLRFIGFAAEEAGLKGSADYAFKARQSNRDIRVMLNYDMIGNRNQGQPDRDFYIVWYPGSEAFSNLHASMATAYTTLTPVFTTSYRSSSDSWSFYQQNYNTLFCIERDFSPYYHSPNDLLQYLDIPYTRDIIKAGLAVVLTLDTATVVGVSHDVNRQPTKMVLYANYPNPFNPSTALSFDIPAVSHVTLKIFDLLGREITTLVDETKAPGKHTAQWDAQGVASGVYYAVLHAGIHLQKRPMLLLR